MRIAATYLLLSLCLMPASAAPEYPALGPDIFDPRAEAETLIDEALVQARRNDKHVLLLFGANWCPWCRLLNRIVTTDPDVGERLRRNHVLVRIDANTRHDRERNARMIAKYGNPLQFGLPVFVVLDRNGKQLATRETQSFSAPSEAEIARRLGIFLDQYRK